MKQIYQKLDSEGCVVVDNVLSSDDVSMTKEYLYEWLEDCGIQRHFSKTWKYFSKDYFYMSPSIHGIMADGPNMFLRPVIFAKTRSPLIEFM